MVFFISYISSVIRRVGARTSYLGSARKNVPSRLNIRKHGAPEMGRSYPPTRDEKFPDIFIAKVAGG